MAGLIACWHTPTEQSPQPETPIDPDAVVNALLDEDYEQVYGYQARGRAGFVGMRLKFGE